jgi:signal recognition particle receptor subunit beta
MRTFILFIFGMFDDYDDIEYFCTQILSESPLFSSVRFIIEREQNIIVIFDSEMDEKELSQELYSYLINDNIKFYFIFNKENIITAHLPKEVKEFMFNPIVEKNVVKLEYEKVKKPLNIDLDQILDKIDESGLESLTPEEKNFLDNFEK